MAPHPDRKVGVATVATVATVPHAAVIVVPALVTDTQSYFYNPISI